MISSKSLPGLKGWDGIEENEWGQDKLGRQAKSWKQND